MHYSSVPQVNAVMRVKSPVSDHMGAGRKWRVHLHTQRTVQKRDRGSANMCGSASDGRENASPVLRIGCHMLPGMGAIFLPLLAGSTLAHAFAGVVALLVHSRVSIGKM